MFHVDWEAQQALAQVVAAHDVLVAQGELVNEVLAHQPVTFAQVAVLMRQH
jgi:hypothetical protein